MMENRVEAPQKTKNTTTIQFNNSTSGYISQGNEKRLSNISTLMFTEASFTIAKIGKQPKCPSTDEWIKKM